MKLRSGKTYSVPYRKASKPRVPKEKVINRKKTNVSDVKQIVQKAIDKNVENKSRQFIDLQHALYYPAQGALYDTQNTIQISPNTGSIDILQGTSDGARIGNKIKIKKATFYAVFVPLGYNVDTNPDPIPIDVKCCLFYDRLTPTTVPAPRTDFFQFNSTSRPIVGELTDICGPFQNEKYRVLATRTFKLGNSKYDGTSFNSDAQAYGNNDYKYNVIMKWDVTKHLVQNVTYIDNSASPSSRGLWMQVMVSPADGNTGSAGVIPCNCQYWIDVQYEDA